MNETALATANDNHGINPFSSMDEFVAAQRIAKGLIQSTLVPKEYQDNLANVMVALELAARIGASPFAVMQNIDMIHGRPSWRATFLIATVNACGRFTPLRYRFEGKSGTDAWGCRAYATDKEANEECVGALITIALAKSEGWSKKSGSKWKTMPEQMLMYRSAAFWTRVYAPELSLGMHTRDELVDAGDLRVVQGGPHGSPGAPSLGERLAQSRQERSEPNPPKPDAPAEPEVKPEVEPDPPPPYDTGEVAEDDGPPEDWPGHDRESNPENG